MKGTVLYFAGIGWTQWGQQACGPVKIKEKRFIHTGLEGE